MYDLIYDIIDHVWQTSQVANSTEQQMIYMICGVVICVTFVSFIDFVFRMFQRLMR